MKFGRLSVLFFTVLILSACSKDEGMEQLNSIESRWDDTFELATSTSRIQLAVPVSKLQELKNELNTTKVSDCLAPAKGNFNKYMDNQIQLLLGFMQDTDFQYSPKIEQYKKENEQLLTEYFSIKAECKK